MLEDTAMFIQKEMKRTVLLMVTTFFSCLACFKLSSLAISDKRVSAKILSQDHMKSGFKDSILLMCYMKKFNTLWCIRPPIVHGHILSFDLRSW